MDWNRLAFAFNIEIVRAICKWQLPLHTYFFYSPFNWNKDQSDWRDWLSSARFLFFNPEKEKDSLCFFLFPFPTLGGGGWNLRNIRKSFKSDGSMMNRSSESHRRANSDAFINPFLFLEISDRSFPFLALPPLLHPSFLISHGRYIFNFHWIFPAWIDGERVEERQGIQAQANPGISHRRNNHASNKYQANFKNR